MFGLTSLGSGLGRLVALPMLAVALLMTPAEAGKSNVGGLYSISVAGFKVGRGTLSLVMQGNAYSAKVSLEPAGIGTLFSTGKGGAEASGWLIGSRVVPSKYRMASHAANLDFYVNLAQGSGSIRSMEVAPKFKPNEERIKVTNRHTRNAIDPLSAALMPVGRSSDTLGPKACARDLPVFDGWTRFDIKLTYEGTKEVSGRGYDGPVVVCKARWVPVAGHRPSKDSVKYMAKADMEVWIAPMGRENVLIPYRISIATQSGRLVVEASKLNIDGGGSDQASR
ncbi:DUF3108 domain-containing protein [Roseibium salinum]|uniref:DUF3108 domain-containing protein n=1 Tax=Roseibium salinum TaxID=1604349 RepID=A0ABT3R7L3_9HYPH|nr:DUF3108 domain-containing protein [Roseibium sp. DSM 29163]MCX2725095.1 DUF3108 domain-containing protein [Roseibium sp. DSM 29163]